MPFFYTKCPIHCGINVGVCEMCSKMIKTETEFTKREKNME